MFQPTNLFWEFKVGFKHTLYDNHNDSVMVLSAIFFKHLIQHILKTKLHFNSDKLQEDFKTLQNIIRSC